MCAELDKLIKEHGWRKGQSVKLSYSDIEDYGTKQQISALKGVMLASTLLGVDDNALVIVQGMIDGLEENSLNHKEL